jgi:hypothetical protein
MLNKIFISHWKIALCLFTIGLIALAIVGAMYWIPPVPRSVEKNISLEELHEQPGPKSLPAQPGK